ncbi:hypothetical protein EXN66_Car002830 [Channa argus]|uniref:Uncharacterized protein n=1 Tax=Channa argus TaxID=215402 RepID=A0A6G1PAU6_CHAAH|nr:hypothetical protein EXN66_Car002830 [Channa argus]
MDPDSCWDMLMTTAISGINTSAQSPPPPPPHPSTHPPTHQHKKLLALNDTSSMKQHFIKS